MALLETRAEQLLNVLCDGGVSTNTFLRRVQNFCVGMNWLPCPVLPAKLWPPVIYKGKRAIKSEEHQRIVARGAATRNGARFTSFAGIWAVRNELYFP